MSIYNKDGTQLTKCYNVDGEELSTAYNVDGDVVFTSSVETDYSDYTATSYKSVSIQTPTQGMELYNGVLFQFRGSMSDLSINNKVCLYNWNDGSSIKSNMAIESGHANAVAFSKTFYNENDEFPLIYCGDWIDPIVHVNRVSRSSSTNLYDIVMDVSDTGYHPNPCIDFDNEIMYMVGYATSSTTSSTNNYIIVSKWDLSDLTDNGNGTYTPTLLDTYTRDFIYVLQDLKYNDGYIWITSGMDNSIMYLRGLDPSTGEEVHTITMPITTEIEGLVWQIDEQTGLWYAYIGFQGGIYYKVTFARAS